MKKKLRAHDNEEHIDETWLIPYSDLLTLLLALFIVLFASTQIDQKKFEQISRSLNVAFHGGTSVMLPSDSIPINQSGKDSNEYEYETPGNTESLDELSQEELLERYRTETENLEELKKQIDQYIEVNGLSTELKTGLDQAELKISISDKALFASASAEVRPVAKEIAMAISEMLSEFPGYEIIVSGHTDDVPIHNAQFEDNWDLSAERALNFMKILLQNDSLDKASFSSVGYGEYRPIATNETAEGRALNRRVEVSVIRNIAPFHELNELLQE